MVVSASTVVTVTISFAETSLNAEEKEAEVLKLLPQLRDLEEVEAVGRVPDPNPPDSAKGFGFLVGLLQTEVTFENFRAFSSFLADRLSGKNIELEVEADGRKLKVVASNQAELQMAIQAAKDFIAS